MTGTKRISTKSLSILELIAEGYGYNQILERLPDITYLDIYAAAGEALRLGEAPSDYELRMKEIKRRYLRAYERWEPAEDESLAQLHRSGQTVLEIATRLQRQPSAIRSRLAKLEIQQTPVSCFPCEFNET